jgi:hypothetical protein
MILERDDEEKTIELNDQNNKLSLVEQISLSENSNQPSHDQTPPYSERLNINKSIIQLEFDFLGEFKNVCVIIPLFQAIKYVPIYARVVRELCLKK